MSEAAGEPADPGAESAGVAEAESCGGRARAAVAADSSSSGSRLSVIVVRTCRLATMTQ